MSMNLSELQSMIRETFGAKDASRGVDGTFMWFMQEVGELATALRSGTPTETAHEFADVLAWLATLANIRGVSLEEAMQAKYGTGCPKCAQTPCTCDGAAAKAQPNAKSHFIFSNFMTRPPGIRTRRGTGKAVPHNSALALPPRMVFKGDCHVRPSFAKTRYHVVVPVPYQRTADLPPGTRAKNCLSLNKRIPARLLDIGASASEGWGSSGEFCSSRSALLATHWVASAKSVPPQATT